MVQLRQLNSRLKTRSIGCVLSRTYTILKRYGWTTERFSRSLTGFVDLVRRYGVEPTLPVTADLLSRHAGIFQKIQAKGVEWAVHGYRHVDYTRIMNDELCREMEKAREAFHHWGLHGEGFRFPYLRRNPDTLDAVAKAGFLWDSSEVVEWPLIPPKKVTRSRWQGYKSILKTYQPRSVNGGPVVPWLMENMVEIPVSVPDDDMLIERLGWRDGDLLSGVWLSMVEKTKERGGVLVLQLHPERFFLFRDALEKVLESLVNESVWMVSMDRLALWWKKRMDYKFIVESLGQSRYRVKAHGDQEAVVSIKPQGIKSKAGEEKGFRSVQGRQWILESPVRPVIGVSHDTGETLQAFLSQEGFLWEKMHANESCSVYLDRKEKCTPENWICVLKKIYSTPHPIIRFSRWPGNKRFAFAVTGDIDGVNLGDFWRRFYG
jgi:peptidoglycan/xylan/chitin deacetylase (PgdA/CDA1 family)